MTRWEALKDLVLDAHLRKRIGAAWALFFYLIFQVDEKGSLTTTYDQLSQTLNFPKPTLKTWRKSLVTTKVVNSFVGKHNVTFQLLPPFDGFLRCNKMDTVTSVKHRDKGDEPLVSILFDLAQRVTRLELKLNATA
jgi:hypothetical protein